MRSIESVLRAALAHRVRRGSTATGAPEELRDDLELTPLEVVLVVLDLEQSGERVSLLDRLAGVRTVGQLRGFLSGDVFERMVARSLAQYLSMDPDAIGLSMDLRDDLRMATLDLELVLLHLESVARVEFPNASVALVRTVGDLAYLLQAVARERAAGSAGLVAESVLATTPA